jgi:hypothetical protein
VRITVSNASRRLAVSESRGAARDDVVYSNRRPAEAGPEGLLDEAVGLATGQAGLSAGRSTRKGARSGTGSPTSALAS